MIAASTFTRTSMTMCARAGTRMFGDIIPHQFGNMYTAVFTLFQVITLDDWFELYDSIRNGTSSEGVRVSL